MSMKERRDQNSNIGLEQKNSIIQAWLNLKDSIFNVLFVLLDKGDDEEEQQSVWGLVFQSGADYMQMLSFPFNTAVISVWNGGQTLNNVTSLFNVLQIGTYLPGVSFNAFLVLLYSLIFLIILVILDIIYVSYSFSKKKFRFTWPLVLLAQIVPLFVTVFFLPMTETLLSVVSCQASQDGDYQVMQSFSTVICWQGWHLFHAAMTLLFVSIFVFISSVVALALFEPRMTTNKLTARQNSTAQVVFIVNKIMCQFIFSFTPFSDTWVYCAMMFIFAFWQFWCYIVNQPYYNKKATKFFKIVSTYYFWTIFMLMVSQILQIYNFNGGLVIWLGGLPFLFIIILFERKSNIGKLFASNLKFRNGQQLQSHITYVLQLIENQKKDKNSYMLLIGYIQKHKQICTQEDCPFSKYLKKKKKHGQNQMEDNCIQLLKQLERMYKMGIKKYPQSTKLRLSFAFFHLQRTKNKNKAYEQFTKAEQTEPSFEEQFIIYRFKKIIRQNLEDNDQEGGGGTDLIQMIRFDNHISLCEQAMLISARLHKEFWAELKQEIPNLKKLNGIGSKITQTGNSVKQNFTQITKINSSVPQIMHSYATYLLLIIQDYVQGRELLANAKKLYQDKLVGDDKLKQQSHSDFQSINDKVLSPIMVISRNQEKLGKILNCNLMLTQISGYYKEELCDRDFHKLLPDTYSQPHQFTLNDWSKRQGESTYFSSSREGFIKQKSGIIVPVIYSVRYNVVEQQFIVHFKLDSSRASKCLVLVDTMGMIKEFSSIARNYLNLQSITGDYNSQYLQQMGISQYENDEYKQGIKKIINVGQDEKQCTVKIRSITMKTDYQHVQENEETQLLEANRRIIGYAVEITPNVLQEKTQQNITIKINSNHKFGAKNYQNSIDQVIDPNILDLYQKPQITEIFMQKFSEVKKQQVTLRKFELKQKIKTMRLLDNQIKMVYNQNSQSDYNAGRQGLDLQDERQIFKFDDQNYQSKLRKAINTNINHIQISQLKWISFFFLILLFASISLQLYFSIGNLNNITAFAESIRKEAVEMEYLAKYIAGSISPLYNKTTYYDQMVAYNVQYTTDLQISFRLQNKLDLDTKNFQDVLILLHSQLLEYFSASGSYTLQNVYYNFVNFVYPAFINNAPGVQLNLLLPNAFFGFAIAVTLAMICFWIYISLQLDKKKYDIMIWFLDIPIPYVSHLSLHCDKYLKEFVGIKELMEKAVNVDQIDQAQYQEYNQNHQDSKQDQIEEQIKARKSLIAKHRKQTLLSKLNFQYFQMMWLLIYACVISILLIVSTEMEYNNFNFLYPHWVLTAKQSYWDSALSVSLLIAEQNSTIGSISMPEMISTLKLNHLNYISTNGMIDFNQQILDYSSTISSTYNYVYFNSLCNETLSGDFLSQCSSLLDGKLTVGYTVYSKYLVSALDIDTNSIRIANEKYVVPSLISVLQSWETTMNSSISSAISLCSILLYVYIIITLLAFLVFWMMYLKRMNTQLNQTIQMLNMIPFKLLPKSRKQTKQFITWIIKQANKKKHQSE